MRSRALTINAPLGTIDIVGTGGDHRNTLNISTAVALTVAACGVPVAKHGNRAVTSKSGSSDVLSALGINLSPEFDTLEECLNEANLCFLYAPRHHVAMRHVANVRKELGIRTIFNLLGPLTNPANVKRHLIGAYELEWLGPMAEVLKMLESEAAWLVHGHDGLDEITTTTMTDVVEMTPHRTHHFTISPQQFDIPVVEMSALRGGDAQHNATELQLLLGGAKGAYRDIVALNAAAALVVGGKSPDLAHGIRLAHASLDSGAAQETLEKVIRISNRSFHE
jgi:anthranilate phosphoribosyltransferase